MNTNITTLLRHRIPLLIAALLMLALLGAACSDSSADAGTTDDVAAGAGADHDDGEDADHDDAEDADHDDGDADHDADADHEEEDLFAGHADAELVVDMQDILFAPTELTITAGEIVEIELQNSGVVDHDFTIEQIDAAHAYHEAEHGAEGHDAHGEEFAMHHALVPGDELMMRVQVHEPGTYEFYCTVPGHREAGMVGTLIVTE